MKVYVCESADSLCDVGEVHLDHKAYLTREAAEVRAGRLTGVCDGIRSWAWVVELEACWKTD